MILYLIIAIGVFAVVSGTGRLVLIVRDFRARRTGSDRTEYDGEHALVLSITSVTAIITGSILIYIGLLLKGIFVA